MNGQYKSPLSIENTNVKGVEKMELIPVLNDNSELEYFESIEEKGAIKKITTVIPEDSYFHITEVIKNGNEEIFKNAFILDRELIEAIKNL